MYRPVEQYVDIEQELQDQKNRLRQQTYDQLISSAYSTMQAKISYDRINGTDRDIATQWFDTDEMGAGDQVSQSTREIFFKRFNYFSKEYQNIYDALHNYQQSEQSEQEIKRECYRIFEYYFNGIIEGDFSTYFCILLENIFENGKIDWSIFPQNKNTQYYDDDEIDIKINPPTSPRTSNDIKKKSISFKGGLNQFGEIVESEQSQAFDEESDSFYYYTDDDDDETAQIRYERPKKSETPFSNPHHESIFLTIDDNPTTAQNAVSCVATYPSPKTVAGSTPGLGEMRDTSEILLASIAASSVIHSLPEDTGAIFKNQHKKRARNGSDSEDEENSQHAQGSFFASDCLPKMSAGYKKMSRFQVNQDKMDESSDNASAGVKNLLRKRARDNSAEGESSQHVQGRFFPSYDSLQKEAGYKKMPRLQVNQDNMDESNEHELIDIYESKFN